MRREHEESPLVAVAAVLMAVGGVVAMRCLLGMGYHRWAVVYMAMGLTASIRRTSAGNDVSTWSALRGLACLMVGLWACRWLGYPIGSLMPQPWAPDELTEAIAQFR